MTVSKPQPRKKNPTRGPAKKTGTGVIVPGESFTVKSFCERLGITPMQVIRMRERGLVARKDGRYVRILADDYHKYLANLPAAELSERESKEEKAASVA